MLGGGIGGLLLGGGEDARRLQLDAGGGQAHLVVAGAILQVTVYLVLLARETYWLDEGNLMLEIADFHVEHLVVLADDLATGLQTAYRLDTFETVSMKGSGDGAAATNIGGIDMPAAVDGAGKHHLALVVAEYSQFGGEADGVNHLAAHGKGRAAAQQQEDKSMVLHDYFGRLKATVISLSCSSLMPSGSKPMHLASI